MHSNAIITIKSNTAIRANCIQTQPNQIQYLSKTPIDSPMRRDESPRNTRNKWMTGDKQYWILLCNRRVYFMRAPSAFVSIRDTKDVIRGRRWREGLEEGSKGRRKERRRKEGRKGKTKTLRSQDVRATFLSRVFVLFSFLCVPSGGFSSFLSVLLLFIFLSSLW